MTIALIDNGSVEPDAHRNLRAVAAGISEHTGEAIEAVSWKHSDRIEAAALDGVAAHTLKPWLRRKLSEGEREFTFIPFFISDQGAIGSALRSDIEAIRLGETRFTYAFTPGLARAGAVTAIAADRIRTAARGLEKPAVIVVDHGGPSRASAALRDRVAADLRQALGDEVGPLAAASMESPEGDAYLFNRPLLLELLSTAPYNQGTVVIAPLFLSPGRHAGPQGDLRQIADAARAQFPGLECRFTELIGTHLLAVETLARALRHTLPLPSIL